jgi:hypothetical protein
MKSCRAQTLVSGINPTLDSPVLDNPVARSVAHAFVVFRGGLLPYEFGGRLQGADCGADLQGLYGGVVGQEDRLQDCGGDRFG